ncbi:MAG: DoxX family protein [Gemmataceae bacterium]|nr:DoxX family protein [Gemmataceae bacterium]
MDTDTQAAPGARWMVWTGWIISVLPALMLLMSGSMKFVPTTPELVESLDHIGWEARLLVALGILEIACTIIYLIPHTAVLGAILLTGYMGGAIATHVRVGDPFFVQAGLGVALWLGLYLRDSRLRALLPLRT